jgi:flagellar secretion chaperone FliS
MYGNAAAKAYRRVDLESAPKTQILERLYDRFARDVADARVAITARNIEAKAKALSHACQIVLQLKMALDHDVAPELCRNLASLYTYVFGRLTQANIKLTTKPLDEAMIVMSGLGDAFKKAHAQR